MGCQKAGGCTQYSSPRRCFSVSQKAKTFSPKWTFGFQKPPLFLQVPSAPSAAASTEGGRGAKRLEGETNDSLQVRTTSLNRVISSGSEKFPTPGSPLPGPNRAWFFSSFGVLEVVLHFDSGM